MSTLHIKAWHPNKAWAVGASDFTHDIMIDRLKGIAQLRGVSLRRLARRILRRETVEIPLRNGVDPEIFILYVAAHGAEVALHSDSLGSNA
jgi:hypothetical protein